MTMLFSCAVCSCVVGCSVCSKGESPALVADILHHRGKGISTYIYDKSYSAGYSFCLREPSEARCVSGWQSHVLSHSCMNSCISFLVDALHAKNAKMTHRHHLIRSYECNRDRLRMNSQV